MEHESSVTLEIENVFGVSSSRLGSGFITTSDFVSSKYEQASSQAQSTTSTHLHIGPCLSTWVESSSVAVSPKRPTTSDREAALVRRGFVRLHRDAVTHLLPLGKSFSPTSTAGDADYVISSSYHADMALWDPKMTSNEPLMRWNVYQSEYGNVDLPINWVAWNPHSKQLAVASGPKNPSMPVKPTADTSSPTLPENSRLTLYDLSLSVPDGVASTASPKLHQSLAPISPISKYQFAPGGDLELAFVAPVQGRSLLSVLVNHFRREHKLMLFDTDNLSQGPIAEQLLPGGSLGHFSATPRGDVIVVMKSATLSLFRPTWNAATKSVELTLLFNQKLSDFECSPLHWLDTNAETTEFLSADSRGHILHFRLSPDLTTLSRIGSISTGTHGTHFNLIWNASRTEDHGTLVRVGVTSLTTHRLPSSASGIPSGAPTASTSNVLHNLTCCGVGFSSNGRWLAIGDWSGLISVWDVLHPSDQPVLRVAIPHSMIRSLTWNTSLVVNNGVTEHRIVAGDTSGKLWRVALQEDATNPQLLVADEPEKLSNTRRTITCLQWSPTASENDRILATGDSDGRLRFYRTSDAKKAAFHKLIDFQAHIQMPHVTSRDIWTLSFSPCGRYIATGSEDYTVHIYKVAFCQETSHFDLLQTLTGPDAAVTCVDWQHTPLGTILVVASDDRTVHCWKQADDGSLQLLRVLRTHWEDLMITYICLESNGSRFACTTMSGYVYVWDLNSQDDKYLSRCKLHLGSLEGLAWNRANDYMQLAVCSSDCTSSLLRMP